MKQKMHIVVLTLLSVVVPLHAGWPWSSNSENKANQEPKITSDGEYIAAIAQEEQLEKENEQIKQGMRTRSRNYCARLPIVEQRINECTEQCTNPEASCSHMPAREQFDNDLIKLLEQATQADQNKLKNNDSAKKSLASARELYLKQKSEKNNKLNALITTIIRYASPADRDSNVLLIDEAQNLAQIPVDPSAGCFVDLNKYDQMISNLNERFSFSIAHGQLYELAELYPEDGDIKRLAEQFKTNSLNAAQKIELINKLYAKKCNVCFAECKKLAQSLPESLQAEFNTAIEIYKNDVRKLNELYKQYAEKNNKVAEENNNN